MKPHAKHFEPIADFKKVLRCRGCGKKFIAGKGNYCDDCWEKMKEMYDKEN